jgi:hypothetical protein
VIVQQQLAALRESGKRQDALRVPASDDTCGLDRSGGVDGARETNLAAAGEPDRGSDGTRRGFRERRDAR